MHNYLDALALAMLERLVCIGSLIEPQAMGDDQRRVDFATVNPIEQWLHVAMDVSFSVRPLAKAAPSGNLLSKLA